VFTFRNARIIALAIAWLSPPPFVHAALLEGEQVFARLHHEDTPSSGSVGDESGFVIVGPGLEVDNLGDSILVQQPVIVDIDFSDTQIVMTAVNERPLPHREFIRISVLGADAPRVRYSLNAASNWAGFVPGAFQPFGQDVDLILFESSPLPGQQIVIDVVPEPAAAGLAAVVSPALLAAHRRRLRHA
jgi:hypothetical protein